jgi:hypothetical protein
MDQNRKSASNRLALTLQVEGPVWHRIDAHPGRVEGSRAPSWRRPGLCRARALDKSRHSKEHPIRFEPAAYTRGRGRGGVGARWRSARRGPQSQWVVALVFAGITYDKIHKPVDFADDRIAHCDKAVRLAPESAELYNDRGFACCGKRDDARAIADYDEALTLDLLFAVARKNRDCALAAT